MQGYGLINASKFGLGERSDRRSNSLESRNQAGMASALVFGALTAGSAWSQPRCATINGQQLHPLQVQRIERLHRSPIADGRYWYDTQTGLWGYEGDARAQGRFVYRCGQQTTRHKSLGERQLLHSTDEILRGRP
jgi:hypothetical protein